MARVTHTSDNTNQGIGFTSAGDLDAAFLKTFTGSGSGYISIWYDQSGNVRNKTQATTANQSTIVSAGLFYEKIISRQAIFRQQTLSACSGQNREIFANLFFIRVRKFNFGIIQPIPK